MSKATVDKIREWFRRGSAMEATHMLIVCENWEDDDFPVYVHSNEDAKKKYQDYSESGHYKVGEVYNLKMNLEEQADGDGRVFNF